MDVFKKYVFKPYESRYIKLFQLEKKKLKLLFGDDVVIEHIGSTAIPGLGGKGIIDILIGVKENLKLFLHKLEEAGYNFKPHAGDKERLFLQKDYGETEKIRRVHIHIVKNGGKEWKKILGFRNYLRANPEKAREYEEIKKKAASICKGNKEIYQSLKKKFIDKMK